MKLSITGVMPPVVVPFEENGDVDYKSYEKNIEKWNSTKLSGYLILGSNSETCYLSLEEKFKIVETSIKCADSGKFIMVGTGAESTRETIKFTNSCAKLGAKAALVLTPSYYKPQMTDDALVNHFKQVADNSDIPVLIYNVPKFTGINVSPNIVKNLCQYENLIGMKDSYGNVEQLKVFKNIVPDSFSLLVGTAGVWYPGLELGIRGGIMALANLLPDKCCDIYELYNSGSRDEAKRIWETVVPVNKAVTATYGVVGLKYAMDLVGYKGGQVRSPLMPLKGSEKDDMKHILQTAGAI